MTTFRKKSEPVSFHFCLLWVKVLRCFVACWLASVRPSNESDLEEEHQSASNGVVQIEGCGVTSHVCVLVLAELLNALKIYACDGRDISLRTRDELAASVTDPVLCSKTCSKNLIVCFTEKEAKQNWWCMWTMRWRTTAQSHEPVFPLCTMHTMRLRLRQTLSGTSGSTGTQTAHQHKQFEGAEVHVIEIIRGKEFVKSRRITLPQPQNRPEKYKTSKTAHGGVV